MIAVSSSVDAIEPQPRARSSGLQPSLADALQRGFHAAASGDASGFKLQSLSGVPCVVLLGEGGSGKSTEMKRWFDASLGSGRSIWVDGRCLASERAPLSELRRKSDFDKWGRGDESLTLWIDGVDEAPCTPLQLLKSLRHELSGYSEQLPRLNVRLACRSTAWTDECNAELRQLGEIGSSFRRIRLRPLSRHDVHLFLEKSGLANVSAAFEQLIERGLGPLLSRPHLLEDVVGAIVAGDELTVLSLRRRGVQRQLARANHRMDSAAMDQRVAAARWIAALSVLHRMPLDAARQRADELEATGRVMRGGGPTVVDIRADIIRGLFEESQLFEQSGALRWTHQSWAEFLCAEWINSLDRTVEEKCALLALADGTMDVLPETIDAVVGYLATIDSKMATELSKRAPLAVLRSDAVEFDARMRGVVLEGVIALAKRQPARVVAWEVGPMLERFVNESCDDLLAQSLLDRSAPDAVRWIGRHGNERTPRQLEAALRVALDRTEESSWRSTSAELVARVGDASLREQLRPLLAEPNLGDGRLWLAALQGVWRKERGSPSLISFDELLAVFEKLGRPSVITGFHVRLKSTLEDDELAALLIAVSPRVHHEWMFTAQELVREIVKRGLCHRPPQSARK